MPNRDFDTATILTGDGLNLPEGNTNFDAGTLFVDNLSNRVGVGKTNPTVELDITGQLAVSANAAFDTDTLFVDSVNNRVGMGISSPDVELEIQSASPELRLRDGVNQYTNFAQNGGTTTFGVRNGISTDGVLIFEGAGSSTEWARFHANGNFLVDTDTLYVDATSNEVGINTTTPSAGLDVVGTSEFNGVATFTDDLVFSNRLTTDGHIQLYDGSLAGGYAIGVESSALYYRSNGSHRFYCNQLADGGSGDVVGFNSGAFEVRGVTIYFTDCTGLDYDQTTGFKNNWIRGDGGTNFQLHNYETGTNGPTLSLYTGEGTYASPANSTSGDNLGNLYYRGYNAGNNGNGASINAHQIGAITTGVPTYITLSTNDGSGLWSTARVRIHEDGEATFGGTTDNGAYNLQCNGTAVWGAAAYVDGSDERIKDEITPITESGIETINRLNPVTFKYKPTWLKEEHITTETGFIAQEVLAALSDKPYVDGVVKHGEQYPYMGVSYEKFIPLLVKAVQELAAENEDLKARVAVLESN